ncbi:fungal-specific transcription factor domain-containing protein [Thelonectria olida]|uniref:Fungal-specific transcription factor domain-containing protein n=1 Tax=Thelonectria olida TaxID=1576542 RepID=A0A9P9ANS6_9HYPO|nr:fungal-specific transcription factor domain-containing protein [Thelonectria olida]
MPKSPSPTSKQRVRVVQGSCWPCKKRRIKCDLTKPVCMRCGLVGAACDYSARLIRWSTRPAVTVPPIYHITSRDEQLAASLAVYEKRALDYFHGRFWPLLTTATEPCTPPILVALEHRVVLLATCVLADAHRWLQDGRNSRSILNVKRLECLAALRVEVDDCCAKGDGPLQTLLFAVLLLYFHDGFLECTEVSASTLSHRDGVLAIVNRLGGPEAVLDTGQDPLHLLLSEFASADLATAMLKGKTPSFPPNIWDCVDKGPVWWGRDSLGRHSLSAVFKEISNMAFYVDSLSRMCEEFSIARIRQFEAALQPMYAPLAVEDLDSPGSESTEPADKDLEATHAYALIRTFQHAALIYLYRAVCGLPVHHPLVQQHTQSCLDCIFGIKRPSKVLNCIVLPLCIAGAHAEHVKQQKGVRNMVAIIYDEIRFASVHSVNAALDSIWKSDPSNMTWSDMFTGLNPQAIVL